MIPRFRPFLGLEEVAAALAPAGGQLVVAEFEAAMARAFGARAAVAFPYGRSALWALCRALGIQGAEVVQPAYTCVVVAHATVLSGNAPRFVDVSPGDFNMDLDEVERAITPRTRAVIATHLFGYPLDVDRLAAIVSAAEAKYGQKIWIIQDCAHAFGARWKGRPVCAAGDVALFGLNISKIMTSVFGGMLTTGDEDLAGRLRAWRDEHFTDPSWLKGISRRLYLLCTALAFRPWFYAAVHWIEFHTRLLDHLTKAYHLDEQVRFPPDYLDTMLPVEARVGLAQLAKLDGIVSARQRNAAFYTGHLDGSPAWLLPPSVEGATYSHYAVRVASRERFVNALDQRGVELGQLIQYSVPHLAFYRQFAGGNQFPVSLACSRHTVNLPVDASVTASDRSRVVDAMRAAAFREQPFSFQDQVKVLAHA